MKRGRAVFRQAAVAEVVSRSHSVRTPIGQITWREAGIGSRILVLLHGLAGNADSWDFQLRTLAEGRRLIAWDCPGYGGSDHLNAAAPDADHYVEALEAFLDALGLGRVDLVGHSMGGIVAARFAARRPQRTRSLILSCSSADFSPAADSFAARVEERRTLPSDEFGRRRAEGMVAPSATKNVRDALAEVASTVREIGLAAAVSMLRSSDNRPLLPLITVPALVIAGRQDRIAPLAEAEAVVKLIPGSQLSVVDGAAHAPYAEQADEYNRILSGFLATLDCEIRS